jgi:hypothetical protein
MPLLKTDREFFIWLAGFIDGEGCIGVRARGRSNNVGAMRLHITNTNKEVLVEIKERLGGSFYKSADDDGVRKASYVWEVSAQKARFILEMVLPFLKVKKSVAKLALDFQMTKKRGNRLNDELLAVRTGLVVKIKKLNRKGSIYAAS